MQICLPVEHVIAAAYLVTLIPLSINGIHHKTILISLFIHLFCFLIVISQIRNHAEFNIDIKETPLEVINMLRVDIFESHIFINDSTFSNEVFSLLDTYLLFSKMSEYKLTDQRLRKKLQIVSNCVSYGNFSGGIIELKSYFRGEDLGENAE